MAKFFDEVACHEIESSWYFKYILSAYNCLYPANSDIANNYVLNNRSQNLRIEVWSKSW